MDFFGVLTCGFEPCALCYLLDEIGAEEMGKWVARIHAANLLFFISDNKLELEKKSPSL